ncbi:hypothetical protein [Microbacterium rhizomatis]|uniref:hypothetical protein n=1 Tax=Microbacterium rhizomatis TaxID=1631477 RepID=UPI00147847A9|nr:hypothetical protein [Microbacterium rhizomatis]
MFILYIVLFLGGMYLFGFAFTVDSWQGLIFFAGIVCVSLALALAFRQTREKG